MRIDRDKTFSIIFLFSCVECGWRGNSRPQGAVYAAILNESPMLSFKPAMGSPVYFQGQVKKMYLFEFVANKIFCPAKQDSKKDKN
ncbi:hypothetical protein AB4Z32_02140 [Massilia sp. 2TAF26]|uniref:hypothetical protein n=1 Tax=Massilia sp. 2TAF26 TaxID=3233012 RepID=UPI003F9DF441